MRSSGDIFAYFGDADAETKKMKADLAAEIILTPNGPTFARERAELTTQPQFERDELARIYIDRGVSPDLAHQVSASANAC